MKLFCFVFFSLFFSIFLLFNCCSYYAVQQLEASLLKKDHQVASKTESWPTSSNNGSIWTPLGGPSLWDGAMLSNVLHTQLLILLLQIYN